MSGLTKPKEYDWKDSNMAKFGSDEDRKVSIMAKHLHFLLFNTYLIFLSSNIFLSKLIFILFIFSLSAKMMQRDALL